MEGIKILDTSFCDCPSGKCAGHKVENWDKEIRDVFYPKKTIKEVKELFEHKRKNAIQIIKENVEQRKHEVFKHCFRCGLETELNIIFCVKCAEKVGMTDKERERVLKVYKKRIKNGETPTYIPRKLYLKQKHSHWNDACCNVCRNNINPECYVGPPNTDLCDGFVIFINDRKET